MITNERQYKVTLAQAQKFEAALMQFEQQEGGDESDRILRNAERESLRSLYEELLEQLREYESLKAGGSRHLAGRSIESIADLLIAARIASHLTQRELAERVGIQEQQVQRYEAEKYQSASLRRIAQLYQALGLDVSVLVNMEGRTPADVFARLYADTAVISE